MRIRRWMIACALAAVAAGIGAAVLVASREPIALRSGTALPEPLEIEDFELVDQHGRAFGRDAFEDRWSLLFTGFTNCPDICPTTLALLATLGTRLPGHAPQIVFVSVDPERDRPEVLAAYLRHFGPQLIGVTGTRTQIEGFTRQLGLAQLRNPGVEGEYTVDHSAALVLIDPRGRVAAYFQPPHDPGALAADLAALMSGAG